MPTIVINGVTHSGIQAFIDELRPESIHSRAISAASTHTLGTHPDTPSRSIAFSACQGAAVSKGHRRKRPEKKPPYLSRALSVPTACCMYSAKCSRGSIFTKMA